MNKYVDFVSDDDFLECVKWVCDGYSKANGFTDKDFHKNTIDPFKLVFDLGNNQIGLQTWIETEKIRQRDKTINNRIGEFHQKLLGKVEGWQDLGVGDESKVDLKKKDNSIFIEIKNKYNTVNSDSLSKVRDKLQRALENNPDAICYWAFIISQHGDSGESVWNYNGKSNPKLRKIWGKKVYELVTGDKNGLQKVWNALPLAISDLTNRRLELASEEKKMLSKFFVFAFENL